MTDRRLPSLKLFPLRLNLYSLLKTLGVFLFILPLMSTAQVQANTAHTIQDSISVYVFLHESCVISQYYSLPLREMYEEYADENLQFIGLFPSESSTPESRNTFKEKYKIPFELKADHHQMKTHALGAEVTPEVIVYNQSTKKILYKGRIDDSYARVGQRKRVTSTSELSDVLAALRNGHTVTFSQTKAIGCIIKKNDLSTHKNH